MAKRHHVILVTGLARAGKTTLLARIYAEATRLTSQRRDYRISFPYLTLSGQEEAALAYIEERWEWIQEHFDARCKTQKEEPVYMDITYHGHTTRFVIYDAPGEAFSARLNPGESEIEAAELERIKKFLKERLSSRRLDAAMVVLNAEQLLSAEGHKSTNLLTDFLTAAKIGEFGATGFPIMVVVTHCASAGVNYEKLQRYLLGSGSKGQQKPGPMDFYKDLAIFCVDNLFDLKRNPQTNKYELPSSRNTGTATQLTPITPQGAWLNDPGVVFSELMKRLERRCRRRRVRTAVLSALAAGLIVGGCFLADVGAYQWAVHPGSAAAPLLPNGLRLEGYLNRSRLWPFKRYTAIVGAGWARLNAENLRTLMLKKESDDGLHAAEAYCNQAEASPYHGYLGANVEWTALSNRLAQDLTEFKAKAREKRHIWPEMAHQNWAGFLADYNASLPHLRAYAPALQRAMELKESLNSEREAEESSLATCMRKTAQGATLESLLTAAESLEKQTCGFAHNRATFDDLMERTADHVWQLRDQDCEPALDALQKLRKNSAVSMAIARTLDERISELHALRDKVVADWTKMEAEVEPLMKSDWKEALALLKNRQTSFREVKRLAVEVNRRIADLEKQLAPAEERYKAARARLLACGRDLDKRIVVLNELAGAADLAPEHKRQFAEEKQEADQAMKDLAKLYGAACEACSQFERDRPALVKGLDAIEGFRSRLKGQNGQPLSDWITDLDGKEKRLRGEKAKDDAVVADAAAFLAGLKIEASQACLDSFRNAGRRIRDALATYRVGDANDLRGEWISKLKSCIEKTLVPSNTREGFKAALGLAGCAEEFDPAQKGYAAAVTDSLKKSWADFEWIRLTQETQHALANADYPAALAAVQKYRGDGEPFEKRVGDAEKLWDEVVTEWNDKFFARLKRMNAAVHDQSEFDNKLSQLDDKAMPPEGIRAAALRELIGRQREAVHASYNQLTYAAVSDRVKKLDRGIIQSWDELDGIDAACTAYLEDRRIPADAKSFLDEVKKLRNRLGALRGPTSLRIESISAWGTEKNLGGLYWITGAYFAPVILRNQDAQFTVADTRKGAETRLDNLLGWKDAYPMDQTADTGADINLPVLEDKFEVKREFRVKPGDKLVIKVYSSKDPAKLDEKLLLLHRELDFKKLAPGFLVAHPNIRFEGAMEGADPELRKGKPAAGMILSITLPDGDRWRL